MDNTEHIEKKLNESYYIIPIYQTVLINLSQFYLIY